MHDLNDALDELRHVIPYAHSPSVRKLSKIATLLLAKNFIMMQSNALQELRRMLICLHQHCCSASPNGVDSLPQALSASVAAAVNNTGALLFKSNAIHAQNQQNYATSTSSKQVKSAFSSSKFPIESDLTKTLLENAQRPASGAQKKNATPPMSANEGNQSKFARTWSNSSPVVLNQAPINTHSSGNIENSSTSPIDVVGHQTMSPVNYNNFQHQVQNQPKQDNNTNVSLLSSSSSSNSYLSSQLSPRTNSQDHTNSVCVQNRRRKYHLLINRILGL